VLPNTDESSEICHKPTTKFKRQSSINTSISIQTTSSASNLQSSFLNIHHRTIKSNTNHQIEHEPSIISIVIFGKRSIEHEPASKSRLTDRFKAGRLYSVELLNAHSLSPPLDSTTSNYLVRRFRDHCWIRNPRCGSLPNSPKVFTSVLRVSTDHSRFFILLRPT
jgi:hypothetical protein